MILWKDIEDYEGIYQVSDTGLIKSRGNANSRKEKILKLDRSGQYSRIDLWKNGVHKRHDVHRLVAKAFIENPHDLPCVNHLDEDKYNNNITNLEWCTKQRNIEYSIRKRMIEKIIYRYKITKEELQEYFE